MYYLRSKPATNAIKFTVDVEALAKEVTDENGVDIKLFNTSIINKENNDTNGKRQPGGGEEVVCKLVKRAKRGENVTQQEYEDCLMCGS